MRRRARVPAVFALITSGVCATPAHAAWPGANGRIVFDAITERQGVHLRTSTLDGRRQRVIARFPPLPIGLERKSGVPQWNPTGERVLYQRLATGIETVSGNGRRRRTLRTSLLWPAWSPTGRDLVAVDAGRRFHSLVRMRPDGSGRRRIPIPRLENVALPRWSPTGRWILFEEGTAAGVFTWRVRPDGTGARRLVEGSRYSWAPSGRRFAYTDGPNVWSVRADGKGRRLLARGPTDSVVAGIAWSPDGRRIAFVRQVPADEHDSSTVLTIPARGGRAKRQFRREHFIGFIDWQPR
jgi:dipeptidyl aminopeptidase/acylaminoacyl peptidase